MRSFAIIFTFLFTFISTSRAGEGMWLPHLLKQLNEAEMQSLGMKMTAEDIYSVNNGSLKDAIVHFGGFCTGEVISSKGLVLTNHHCGYSRIQSHSTLDRNYLKNGFWARSINEELPNPGLFVTFISRIEEVTDQALKGITDELDEKERSILINQNLESIKSSSKLSEFEDVLIRPFYHGNQYFMFVTVTYRDVRLVGAPPSSIGKFGADTDNWEWPRHTGDFALFRIYADKDNNPAEYSESNVPYKAKHHLPISLDGVEEGDFTMVFGFPGRTEQYIPAVAVEQIVETLNPLKIEIRERALAILDQAMRNDPAIQIKYASKYASVANYYKKWIGESQGLIAVDALQKKKNYESEFQKKVNKNRKWKKAFGDILTQFNVLYASYEPLAYARDLFSETLGRNSDMMRYSSAVSQLIRIGENNGKDAFFNRWNQSKDALSDLYKDYDAATDEKVYAELLSLFDQFADESYYPAYLKEKLDGQSGGFDALAASIYSKSYLTTFQRMEKLMEGDDFDYILKQLKTDPAYMLYSELVNSYNGKVIVPLREIQEQIDPLQRLYMKAQMEVMDGKTFWPDANSTLRVTYGQAEGYQPRDAVKYKPITYLSGVVDKYVPGDYEFDLPPKLLQLVGSRDFGIYTDATGDVPVCFLGSNHTTGGNSGSPAIDAYGNLIGLNFDRVWEGTMSDLNYDRSICRNIMVDARYILFIIDKYANAKNIMSELSLVYPKSNKTPPVYPTELKEGRTILKEESNLPTHR